MLQNLIGSHLTVKGKISKTFVREIEGNKIVFCFIAKLDKPESVVFTTVDKDNVQFDIEAMDFSKTYIYAGKITGTNSVDADYLKLAAIQGW